MKTRIATSAQFLFTLLVILFAACKKDPIVKPQPIPGNDSIPTNTDKAFFSFTANANLNGQPYHSSNLKAVVTIINQKNEEVVTEKILTVTIDGSVKTQNIELPVGTYKLAKFRLEYGAAYTHFAAPLAASAKASLVQKPLAFEFKVEKGAANSFPVEVLKVQAGEKPQFYGYPSGAFDNSQQDADPYLKVKLQAIMRIGEVVYDSVPASLTLSTFNSNGETTTVYVSLKAGVNELQLLKSAVKYHLRVSRWGITDTMTLDRANANEETVYTMGGSKEAKKLKSETVLRLVDGQSIPESKANYKYNTDGNLSKIEYWLRKKDNTSYLSMTHRFEYDGKKVSKISMYDEETKALLRTTSFSYDNQGKVTAMSQVEHGTETRALVTYNYGNVPGFTIHYDNPGNYDMDYQALFYRGNILSSEASTTSGNHEKGNYDYDVNINPYRHMNWPDFYLSHSSANNKTNQWKQYFGAYPENEPYNFSYTYDADGYPTEKITKYKNYLTGKELFSTKTIFVY